MTERDNENKHFAMIVCCLLALLIMAIADLCKAGESDAEETTLWLARSCVGEAGWGSVDSGECAAIMHIYQKRGELNGRGTLWTALRYSAAIKPGRHHRNRWVRHLRGDEKPKYWPDNLKWSNYAEKWNKVYWHAWAFVNGQIEDPLPDAMHYGSRIDAYRAHPRWKRIKAPYRNWFWSVRGMK